MEVLHPREDDHRSPRRVLGMLDRHRLVPAALRMDRDRPRLVHMAPIRQCPELAAHRRRWV